VHGNARLAADVVEAIATSKRLGVRAGTAHRYTAVWVVVVEGRIFVRSWNDKPTGWFRAFSNEPNGTVHVAGLEIPVRAALTRSARVQRAVTRAYGEKYNTTGSQKWVAGFAEPGRELATLELVLREATRDRLGATEEGHMRYVDGYVVPVPTKKLKAYVRMAQMAESVWRKHGALDYKECVGDDLETKWGVPFPRVLKLKRGETVVFSYIVFKSRAHRDRVNARVMKELAGLLSPKDMPFDATRMVCGGFKVLVGG
jgi:uncharacterized protein YbaA (DUF1428 family)